MTKKHLTRYLVLVMILTAVTVGTAVYIFEEQRYQQIASQSINTSDVITNRNVDINQSNVIEQIPLDPPTTQTVTLFFIKLDDAGASGEAVGCGDSVVGVEQMVPLTTKGSIATALSGLFAIDTSTVEDGTLYNALAQSSLAVDSVTLDRGIATVALIGTLQLGGVCDDPRVIAQLEQTIKQFDGIARVQILLNGEPFSH